MAIRSSMRAVSVLLGLISFFSAASSGGPPPSQTASTLKADECLEVKGLAFAPGTKDTLTWLPSACGTAYGLERGWISNRGFDSGFDRCLATEIPGTFAVDQTVPDPGEVFTYNVGGLQVNEGTKEVSGRVACGARLFVDPGATGAGTGRTWKDAFTKLQAAVDSPWGPYTKELWVKGPIEEPTVKIPSKGEYPSFLTFSFLGGFQGTETYAWERRPLSDPTLWQGNPQEVMLDAGWRWGRSPNLIVDGFVMRGGRGAIDQNNMDGRALLEVRNTRIEGSSGHGIWLSDDDTWNIRWVTIRDSSFDTGLSIGFTNREDASIRGRITRNHFSGASGSIIYINLYQYCAIAEFSVDIIANKFVGGRNAIEGIAHSVTSGRAIIDSIIGSNLFEGSLEDAIYFEASLEEGSDAKTSIHPVIVGNTIVGAGWSGVNCEIKLNSPGTGAITECRPQLWDNLITNCQGYGFREGPDDPAHNAYTDPILVGNDIFGNGAMYLDEGVTVLNTPEDVNALAGFRDNACFDPQYINPAGKDFHLAPSSPALNRGHRGAPGWPLIDADGRNRVQGPAPDLGAFETP